ncbi:methyltransferase domain-containing protein [Streptomyces lycii]|uniref:methyltransferase domain-containing protein n=1 Tax=Streptomyces lycii TaxID=2654337 RepID=UPI001F1B7178|nr:methyltransferase domain-containing protein [Streptomyces lycii]
MRREIVARQLEEQLAARFPFGQRLRVLDVGVGPGPLPASGRTGAAPGPDGEHPGPEVRDGTQALRLARAGHRVTLLESDPAIQKAVRTTLAAEPEGIRERFQLVEGDARETGAHFTPGSFDVVLCHGVLMYVAEPDPILAGLARVLAPGGLLSLLVRNADALAMRPGLAGDWQTAHTAFDSPVYVNRAGAPGRALSLSALSDTLTGIGTPLHAWYGVRVFTDQAADDAQPADVRELERMLAAEERAGRTDPYRAVAALLHLCGVRGAPREA